MSDELKKEIEAAAYTMPGISKHEMIDLDKVMEILNKHLAVRDEKEPEFFNF